MPWFLGVTIAAILVFLLVIVPAAISSLLPPEHFVTWRAIVVEDGRNPTVHLDREEHRAFTATRVVELREGGPTGLLVCRRTIRETSPPAAEMPLSRWVGGGNPCALRQVPHVMLTTYTIPVRFWPRSSVEFTVASNMFTVR